jgi:hypothetical protein
VGLCKHVGVILVTSQRNLGSSLYESLIKVNDLLELMEIN